MTQQLQVGLIGLGAMGAGMAGSLRRAGYAVRVCDVRHQAALAFANKQHVRQTKEAA